MSIHIYIPLGPLSLDTAENKVTIDARRSTRLYGLHKRDETNIS